MRAPAGRNRDLASQRRQYERDLRNSPWLFFRKEDRQSIGGSFLHQINYLNRSIPNLLEFTLLRDCSNVTKGYFHNVKMVKTTFYDSGGSK